MIDNWPYKRQIACTTIEFATYVSGNIHVNLCNLLCCHAGAYYSAMENALFAMANCFVPLCQSNALNAFVTKSVPVRSGLKGN